MLREYLENILDKKSSDEKQPLLLSEEEIEECASRIDNNASSFLALIKDNEFLKKVTNCEFKVTEEDEDEYLFSFFLINKAIEKDPSFFPELMKNKTLKNIYIDQIKQELNSEESISFFDKPFSDDNSKILLKNLNTIFDNKELLEYFLKSGKSGKLLLKVLAQNPQFNEKKMLDPKLNKALLKEEGSKNTIKNILELFKNKKIADAYFINNPELFTKDEQISIQNKITENYRNSYPDSLRKLCLYEISESAKDSKSKVKVPEELEEEIRYFTFHSEKPK